MCSDCVRRISRGESRTVVDIVAATMVSTDSTGCEQSPRSVRTGSEMDSAAARKEESHGSIADDRIDCRNVIFCPNTLSIPLLTRFITII